MNRLSDRPYRFLFNEALDALLVVDRGGRCLEANSAARRVLEISPDVQLGITSDGADAASDSGVSARFPEAQPFAAQALPLTLAWVQSGGDVWYLEGSVIQPLGAGLHLIALRDVTARVRADAQVRSLQKALAGSAAECFCLSHHLHLEASMGLPLLHCLQIPGEGDPEIWLAISPAVIRTSSSGGATPQVQPLISRPLDATHSEAVLRRYERIVSATSDGISLVDQNYIYQTVNQPYLERYHKTYHQIVGHSVAELLGEDVFEQIVKPRLDAALAGELVHYHDWFTYPELGRRFLEIIYAPYLEMDGRISGVVVTIRDETDRKAAEITLQRQVQREHLLATITNRLRRSLDLSQILDTTVAEVRQFLQTDRVLVYRLHSRIAGTVVAESAVSPWRSLLGELISDPCLQLEGCIAPYVEGKVQAIADIQTAGLADCHREMLQHFQVRANLVLPLLRGEQVWGFLIANHCQSPREWASEEIALLQRLTDQLAIAIQQSELYQQVQQLNVDLERQVSHRTAELQQALEFETLLKQITDQVRDDLDEAQILQTVVEGLGQGLSLVCCDTGIYNADQTTSTITHEYTQLLNPAMGTTFALADATHPDVYPYLLRGEFCQFSDVSPHPLRANQQRLTVLACPIMDERQVLGDLWLFKPTSTVFNHLEVRLVQQVANQCAIAIRQARLYQAAQAQVHELERLNRLKDDFLSTVSHELRTPMASIKMATQLIEIELVRADLLGHVPPSALDRYFQILKEECHRETVLINDLLDLTRVDSDADPVIPTLVNLQMWVPHIAEAFIERAQRQQQQLHIHIADGLMLPTDLAYLERILTELLTNACKYTPAGGTIHVIAETVENGIRLVVSNSGVELPAVECDRIFDKFYRIPNNDPWKHGGTGLGLALVKKLAEKLGATIQAKSQNQVVQMILEFPLSPPTG
ncbi:MAG: GAF domain-containing protein [Synechococcales bacterium]|nr:GAF domain-containing protein [Synechococcales bacterium]